MPAIVVSGTDSKDKEISPLPHDEPGDDSQLGYSGLDSMKIPSSSLGMNLSSGIFSGDPEFLMAGNASRLPSSRKFYDVAEDIDRALETLEIPATTRAARLDAVGIANASASSVDMSTDFSPLYSSELGAIAEEDSCDVGKE